MPDEHDPAAPPTAGQPAAAGRFYPLDLDRILRLAGSLLRFAWRPMLGAALIPYLIAYAVLVPVAMIASPQLNVWVDQAEAQSLASGTLPAFPAELRPWALVMAGAALIVWIAGMIAAAAVIQVAHAVFRGQRISAGEALRAALPRTPALVGAQLLLLLAAYGVLLAGSVLAGVLMVGGGLAAFLGLIVLVGSFAAMLFVVVRWTLAGPVIVVERVGPVNGLSRSWRLVFGSGWRMLGYTLLIGLLSFLFGIVAAAIPAAALGLDGTVGAEVAMGTVLDGIAALLFTPVGPLFMTLLYYDLRFRAREPAPLPGEAGEAA